MKPESFPRYPLLFGPSPVHPLERLSAHLGGARIWAKRDDCNSVLTFGGNKVRKLEYLVADAIAEGCDTQRCCAVRSGGGFADAALASERVRRPRRHQRRFSSSKV